MGIQVSTFPDVNLWEKQWKLQIIRNKMTDENKIEFMALLVLFHYYSVSFVMLYSVSL